MPRRVVGTAARLRPRIILAGRGKRNRAIRGGHLKAGLALGQGDGNAFAGKRLLLLRERVEITQARQARAIRASSHTDGQCKCRGPENASP